MPDNYPTRDSSVVTAELADEELSAKSGIGRALLWRETGRKQRRIIAQGLIRQGLIRVRRLQLMRFFPFPDGRLKAGKD